MGLSPIGHPTEEIFYDYFYASKTAVRIKVGLGLGFWFVLRLGLVSGL